MSEPSLTISPLIWTAPDSTDVVTSARLIDSETYIATSYASDTHYVCHYQVSIPAIEGARTANIKFAFNSSGILIDKIMKNYMRAWAAYFLGSPTIAIEIPTIKPIIYPLYQEMIDQYNDDVYRGYRGRGSSWHFRPLVLNDALTTNYGFIDRAFQNVQS